MALRLPASKASKLLNPTPSIHSFSLPSHLPKLHRVSNLSSEKAAPLKSKRNFSSSLRPRNSPTSPTPTPNPTESSKPKGSENPGFEAASFSDMFKNASKSTRMVLIVGLVLVSTTESVTWGIWGWNKWKNWRSGEVVENEG